MLYNTFRPQLLSIKNPIVNAHLEQKNHWHSYLGIMKEILLIIEVSKHIYQNLQVDNKRPPNMFSLAPLSSFQHHHIMLDNSGCQHLCQLFRKMNRVKISDFPNLKLEQVFDKTKVENITGTKLISGTLSTDGLQA